MKGFIIISLLALALNTSKVYSQVVIRAGTEFGAENNSEIVMQVTGDLVNNTPFDFSTTKLYINLLGADQIISGDWSANGLRLGNTGNKRVNNNLTVTNAMDFTNGVLIPSATAKILYTGHSDNITADLNGSSYVKGIFYQAGRGRRNYPIGTASAFSFLSLLDVQTENEIGVEVFDTNPGLIPDVGLDFTGISRYWKITTTDPAQLNSLVQVSLNGITIPAGKAPTVVQASALNSPATNLGTSSTDIGVTSGIVVTAPIISIGATTDIAVKVRDLITPFGSTGINDGLYIENIEHFKFNTVTLLDRWGVVVKRWTDFRNNVSFDFNKLSPGNYVCIVEYGNDADTKMKISQMVTVLKTN
jgi:hypothetical protein